MGDTPRPNDKPLPATVIWTGAGVDVRQYGKAVPLSAFAPRCKAPNCGRMLNGAYVRQKNGDLWCARCAGVE